MVWCRVVTRGLRREVLVECNAKFSKTTLEAAFGSEKNIRFTVKKPEHSCGQHADCTLTQKSSVPFCCLINLYL